MSDGELTALTSFSFRRFWASCFVNSMTLGSRMSIISEFSFCSSYIWIRDVSSVEKLSDTLLFRIMIGRSCGSILERSDSNSIFVIPTPAIVVSHRIIAIETQRLLFANFPSLLRIPCIRFIIMIYL